MLDNTNCLVCKRVNLNTSNKLLVSVHKQGYWVFGDYQKYKGYSLYLLKNHVEDMDLLTQEEISTIYFEIHTIAKVIKEVTKCSRVNIELQCNKHHHLHWHLFPRYDTDDFPELPVWVDPNLKSEKVDGTEDWVRSMINKFSTKYLIEAYRTLLSDSTVH